jgi:hypothetical protein
VAGLDHDPGSEVDLCDGGPGAHRIDARLLRRRHEVPQLAQAPTRLAERHRPRHVRVVAAGERAEVELHDVAAAQRAIGRRVVRLRRLLAEGHDRRTIVVGAGPHGDLEGRRARSVMPSRRPPPSATCRTPRRPPCAERPLDLGVLLARPRPPRRQ